MDAALLVVQIVSAAGIVIFAARGLARMGKNLERNRVVRALPRPVRQQAARRVRRGELPLPTDADREVVLTLARAEASTGRWVPGMLGCLAVSNGALVLALDDASTWQSVLTAASAGCCVVCAIVVCLSHRAQRILDADQPI